jgi:hypothetical protein
MLRQAYRRSGAMLDRSGMPDATSSPRVPRPALRRRIVMRIWLGGSLTPASSRTAGVITGPDQIRPKLRWEPWSRHCEGAVSSEPAVTDNPHPRCQVN